MSKSDEIPDMEEKTTISLGAEDCAIVLRGDGAQELFLPHDDSIPDDVAVLMFVFAKLDDAGFRDMLLSLMERDPTP